MVSAQHHQFGQMRPFHQPPTPFQMSQAYLQSQYDDSFTGSSSLFPPLSTAHAPNNSYTHHADRLNRQYNASTSQSVAETASSDAMMAATMMMPVNDQFHQSESALTEIDHPFSMYQHASQQGQLATESSLTTTNMLSANDMAQLLRNTEFGTALGSTYSDDEDGAP
jgi:hypothetical protein